MIRKQKVVTWLQIAYWLGAGVDLVVGLGMIFPALGCQAAGINCYPILPAFRSALGIAGVLTIGWSVLLLWADQDPLNRKGILLITVFPVMVGIAFFTGFAFLENMIPARNAFTIWTFQVLLSIFFLGGYLNALRYQRELQSPQPGPYIPSWEKK
jgi:hypothetical protein